MSASEIKLTQAHACHQQGQLAQATDICEQILSAEPRHAEALHLLGVIAYQTNNLKSALELFNRAIDINPNNPMFYSNRGNVLKDLQQLEAAIENYDRAIALNPNFLAFHFNRGIALQALMHLSEAAESYNRAIAIKPDFVDAYFNLANTLLGLKQTQAAVDNYHKALALAPNYAKVYVNLGLALQVLGQFEAAIENYNHAIAIKPDLAESYFNRGSAQQNLKQFEAAVVSYAKAITLKPDIDYSLGDLIHIKMKLCDWSNFKENIATLSTKISAGVKVSSSYPLLALIDSPGLQRKATEIYANDKRPTRRVLGDIPKRSKGKKIRIGYFSADFRLHASSFLLAELFELHDKNRFELIAFSYGPETQDTMRKRLENAFDQFIDVRHLLDEEVATLARELEIDIAVDLGGDTSYSRSVIFSYRAALIQVGYLGYPGTMGADYFDYLIADHTIIPEALRQYYVEKIAYLPNSYQANDRKRKIADTAFSRAEFGLPENSFVFCCFNNNHKITPNTFDSWMRILKSVNNSYLFLVVDNDTAKQNLQNEARARSVDPNRLVFGNSIEFSEYLARYCIVDLFLNTFPFDAGTTASDALWAGVPVLTRAGETFVSRVAASLLKAIGLPELITESQENYEALAIELATHPAKFKLIKEKLAANRLTTPLFNTPLFTQHIEEAYTRMMERYYAGLAPDHIYVKQ